MSELCRETKGSPPEGEETFGFFKEFFEFFELSRSDAEKFALRICSMEFALQIPLRVFSHLQATAITKHGTKNSGRHDGLPELYFYKVIFATNQTLNLKRTTSPSAITYSLPSLRISPLSRATAVEPQATRSSKAITSARIKPLSKSV